MPNVETSHLFKTPPSSDEIKSQLKAANCQLVNKYTWLQIENNRLFFKIIKVVELRRTAEILWNDFKKDEFQKCGSIEFGGKVLPVFDFRKTATPDTEVIDQDNVIILQVEHFETYLFIGILYNVIDEIIF